MSCTVRADLFLCPALFVSAPAKQLLLQVAARTEIGVRRRTQAMSRSCSKRKSRFSSLWGLDTTSKKTTKAHPSINQVSFIVVNSRALASKALRFPPAYCTEGHLTLFSCQQVFADGKEPVKNPSDGIHADPAKEHMVGRFLFCFHLYLRVRSRLGTSGWFQQLCGE